MPAIPSSTVPSIPNADMLNSSQMALMMSIIPPILGFWLRYTAPPNPSMEASMALTPNAPTEGAKAENIRAITPPISPNIPPRIPNTISRVRDVSASNFFPPPYFFNVLCGARISYVSTTI